jgi:hypothetical protein
MKLKSNLVFSNGSSQSIAGVTTADTGTVSNTMLANSSITVNGTSVSLGGSATIATDPMNNDSFSAIITMDIGV